jgi:hypothetical protein
VDVLMLFLQGTRDEFAQLDLLTEVCEKLGSRATLHLIEDGDHSFKVPKRTGKTGGTGDGRAGGYDRGVGDCADSLKVSTPCRTGGPSRGALRTARPRSAPTNPPVPATTA